MMKLAALVTALVVSTWILVPELPQVAGVDVVVEAVADSGTYYVYDYQIGNPTASTWGISTVTLDIAAGSGTPANLATSGALFDLTTSSGPPAVAAHAEVGPITPSGWEAALTRQAKLSWYTQYTISVSDDSIAPGATVAGFGIRSSYLPEIVDVVALPTVESCCQMPTDSAEGEFFYPTPSQYPVHAKTLAPRYLPSEVDLSLVQDQVEAVCGSLAWINDSTLCESLADSLEAAETRLLNSDVGGARSVIDATAVIVYQNREPIGGVSSNAEWLLVLNLEQLLENLPAGLSTWAPSVAYTVGDEVSHQGLDYRCRQSHTSQTGWEPPNVYALWERINTGGLWAAQVLYQADDEAEYGGVIYRVIQGHQSQAGWEPPNQPALWTPVS